MELTELSGPLAQDPASGSNSPNLVPSRSTHLNTTADDEDYREEQGNGDEESARAWDGNAGNASTELPEAALGPDNAPDTTTLDDEEGMLPRDVQEKTAYYDYTSEKQLSQADAKLFYQRSKFDAQMTGDSSWGTSQWGTRTNSPQESPTIVPNSMAHVLEADQGGIHSSASMASMQSGRNVPQR